MANTNIPKDPIILLSYVNTKLRDEYSSLDALCDDLSLDPDQINQILSAVGYTYDAALNKYL